MILNGPEHVYFSLFSIGFLQICEDEYKDECSTDYTTECQEEYSNECQTDNTTECSTEYSNNCNTEYSQECTTEYSDQCKTDYTDVSILLLDFSFLVERILTSLLAGVPRRVL